MSDIGNHGPGQLLEVFGESLHDEPIPGSSFSSSQVLDLGIDHDVVVAGVDQVAGMGQVGSLPPCMVKCFLQSIAVAGLDHIGPPFAAKPRGTTVLGGLIAERTAHALAGEWVTEATLAQVLQKVIHCVLGSDMVGVGSGAGENASIGNTIAIRFVLVVPVDFNGLLVKLGHLGGHVQPGGSGNGGHDAFAPMQIDYSSAGKSTLCAYSL